MKLIHYSAQPITKVRDTKQFEVSAPDEYRRKHPDARKGPNIGKPSGFWLSVEGNGEGWYDWCKAENFRPECLKYAYEITLAGDANILYIRDAIDIKKFTEKYLDTKSEIYKLLNKSDLYTYSMDIAWREVAKDYQGIIITPYVWECRLSLDSQWYYTWDCASGCIWDAKAIKSIKLSKQDSKNHVCK